MQWDERPGYELTLNPDLTVRGERGQQRLQIITPDVENEIERRRLLDRIEIHFYRRNTLTLDKVQRLYQCMIDIGLHA